MKKNDYISKIRQIYRKNREIVAYLFWGACTTTVSVISFVAAHMCFNVNELAANLISWFFAVSFAYITNKIRVFRSSVKGLEILREIFLFFSSRMMTLLLEEIIMAIFAVKLSFNGMAVKTVCQFVVLVTNYIISKFITFKK